MKVCGRDMTIRGRVVRIATPELDKYEVLNDPEDLVKGLRKCGVQVNLLSFMQLVPETAPKYTYYTEQDNLAVLPVSTFDHWWNHQIRSYPRNRARQAEKKGVTVREVPFDGALVHGMQGVYSESPIRQGKPNVHYGKDFETVYRDEATFLDRSIFIGAFLGEELIGFAKLVTDQNRTLANLMNIVAMVKHRDKAPTNALIAQAVRICADRGIQYLLYQNFTYGRKKPDSLTNFKEVNGFQRIDVPRYYIPLTTVGWLALRLRLHHKLVDRLPEPLTAKLREIRRAWYVRRFPSEADAT